MEDFLFVVLKTVGIYILIIICLRLLGKKGLGELSAADLVLIIIIGEGISTIIPQETDFGGVAVYIIALAATNYGIEYWAFKSKKFNKILEGEPVILVRNGKALKNNMYKERVTLDTLKEALRTKGMKNIEDVDLAILETDGEISVIPVKTPAAESQEKK
jgi:uncharacterized membrane protein YcaP (DUF421 family)